MRCRICENEDHNILHIARDSRHNLGAQYEYIECSNCGCVQIRRYPSNIESLYPTEYYAHQPLRLVPLNPLRNYLRTQWINYGLSGKNMVGLICNLIKPVLPMYKILGKNGIGKNSTILDIGCGNGTFLLWLSRAGFTNLIGIDPYLSGDIHCHNGPSLFKRGIENIDRQYDLISLQHSFEHMPHPVIVLNKLYDSLKDEGLLMISIPVIGYAWRKYSECWVGLDDPGHFYLHTSKSFQILCTKGRFNIVDVYYNSNVWQFIGSELNCRKISEKDLVERKIKLNQLFTRQELAYFRKKAKELNEDCNGDQAFFFLKKIKVNPKQE